MDIGNYPPAYQFLTIFQVNLSRDQSGCGHEENSGTRDGRGRLSGDGVSRVWHGYRWVRPDRKHDQGAV
jgi:hypothetical protein